jgi:uncharacterized membrane protein HdeD (DUF308 family)
MPQSQLKHLDGSGLTLQLARTRRSLTMPGVILIVAGITALALPSIASLAVEAVVGWAFVLVGISQLMHAFRATGWAGFAGQLLMGMIFLVAGVTLITNPVAGLISLTVVIIATFVASGILKLLVGFRLRPLDGWGWFIVLGLLSLAVGLLIWNRLPSSAAWSLGLVVGIDFISTGLVFLRFASLARQRPGTITAAA